MAFGVPVSVYLLFNADYTKGPIALKLSHPCLEDHNSYCINGVCAFHHELKKALCRCFTGYTGERCEHLTLTSYALDSYDKYIAIGIGVGLLLIQTENNPRVAPMLITKCNSDHNGYCLHGQCIYLVGMSKNYCR
ncbi:Epigen [Pteropus alecto]|uniref:Epigen n=1 Tax=Pteropus alecto TaxID=9402 RepID=L5KZN2_PTEAL|nr:Epigen [Pteropus alecto]